MHLAAEPMVKIPIFDEVHGDTVWEQHVLELGLEDVLTVDRGSVGIGRAEVLVGHVDAIDRPRLIRERIAARFVVEERNVDDLAVGEPGGGLNDVHLVVHFDGSPSALADAQLKLIDDAGLRQKMSETARRYSVERYSLTQQSVRLMELYEKLLTK